MAKTIKFNLFSEKSILEAQKKIDDYRNSLQGKCDEIVSRLADIGEMVAIKKINESPIGKAITLTVNKSSYQGKSEAVLFAVGEVKQSEGYAPFNLLFAVEFGSGITYNKTKNPKADGFGMGVGSFPGQIHAFDQDGWYYWDSTLQKWRHTFGIKATMPMYNADMAIIKEYMNICKTVFKK